MRFLVLALIQALVLTPLFATDEVHFMNILVDRQEDGLIIRTEPESMLDYDLLKIEDYDLRKNTYDNTLDAPLRQTAYLLRTLERNRGTVLGNRTEPLPILRYGFELAVRDITGEPIDLREYEVILSMSTEKDGAIATVKDGTQSHTFSIVTLTQPEAYDDFINKVCFPFVELKTKLPPGDEFLVDLYYKWPRVEVDEKDFNIFDLFPSTILWDRGIVRKLKIHLGTTYCFKRDGVWNQVNSQHLRTFAQDMKLMSKFLDAEKKGDPAVSIPLLEDYVTLVPSNRKALKKLMDIYLAEEMNDQAYNLISRFQPFFATIREGLGNQKELEAKATRQRNWLLGRKGQFEKDKAAIVKITAPFEGDLVTGTTYLEFTLANDKSPLLEVECFLDEQRIARQSGPPFRVPFTVDGSMGHLKLSVRAYFENETYAEDEISLKSLSVDEQELVNLVALRASVFQKNNDGVPLTMDDFEVIENDKNKKIEHFRRDTAPLRVAIVLDSSISMFGKKLYRAQYAVKTFLGKLQPDDRAAIYTFDHKVMQLNDFTNDFAGISPQIMTISPQWATSLYDAMVVAQDALMGQNGTKVMIVVSDGDDSSSNSTDIHVAGLLKNSPIMVYSIILPGGVFDDSVQGAQFLQAVAELTGSIYTRIHRVDNLDETFDRIYEDLRSFYYIDYYSDIRDIDKRELRVKIKKSGAKLRYRTLN